MSNYFELFIQPGLICGLCYGIAAIGVSLPLRFLGTADFTSIGAIMLGGIVTITVTNASNCVVGLLLGAFAAGLLGVVTGAISLSRRLNIALMLAGIICFTATRSIGLLIAKNGQVELNPDAVTFMSQRFTWHDALTIGGIALVVCVVTGLLARSKLGCFAFAMCANSRFVKFRHRKSKATTIWLLFTSNLLIGLCGGLLAIKSKQAYVDIHVEFLSLTLGAIYAGHAGVQLVARLLRDEIPTEIPLETQANSPEESRSFWEKFRVSLSTQRDDSEKMWFIFISYVCASILLTCVTQSVRGQVLFNVPPQGEHLIVAVIITVGLWISSMKPKTIRKT